MTLSVSLLAALAAILSGALLGVQAPINAQAGAALGSPLAAATLSFLVGVAALLMVTFLFAQHQTHLAGLRSVPPYVVFSGGLLGACYVTAAIILAPRLGVAALVSLAIAGQLAAGLVLLGLAERSVALGEEAAEYSNDPANSRHMAEGYIAARVGCAISLQAGGGFLLQAARARR